MFGYPCPFCSQRLLAAPERAGQRTICPKCLKPIVIPKPEVEKPTDAEAFSAVPDAEPDEVPISMMPDRLDVDIDESNDPGKRTPIPEPRPAARIGPPAGTYSDPIALQPAAALLVRHPESVSDLESVAAAPIAAEAPGMSPTPLPLPMPSYPEPIYPPSPPKPAPPRFTAPAPVPTPAFPAPGRITGDHPASAVPPALAGATSGNTAGLVVFNPTDVEAANIAAQLTTVISMTMKPAPEPPSDLRLTTGLWITLTACGAALWLFCMMSDPEPLKYVAVIGAIELVIGYFWVAVAWGNKNPKQGFSTLFPPLWVYRAANPPYEPGYRPLRFVVAGAVLLSMFVIAPKVQPTIYGWIGIADDQQQLPPDKPETPLMKLHVAESDGDTLGIKRQLALFAKPESLILSAAHEKPAVIATLNRLVRGPRAEIRDDALRALAIWSKDDAKPNVLAAISKGTDEERETAYELVTAWNDDETVQLLVKQLGTNNLARPALDEIGRSPAGRAAIERAILPYLRANAVERRNDFLALASEYGGSDTIPVLEAQLAKLIIASERESIQLCIAKIQARLSR
jgi:hypothetical protein